MPVVGTVTVPTLRVRRQGLDLHLSWTDRGTDHDVVSGDLAILRATDGDFTAAVGSCIADDLVAPSLVLPVAAIPAAAFFLVRSTCADGGTTYDSGDPGQVGSRDAEIAAAAGSCPALGIGAASPQRAAFSRRAAPPTLSSP